jgi:hypothetical protein
MATDKTIMCPSHRCKPGSKLIGVRQEDGTVAILPQALPIDENFIEKAKQHPMAAEQRFRFTNKCIEGGCNQWDGKGCGVANRMLQYLDQVVTQEALPPCAIRQNCRWFLQEGPESCKICPYVLTEISEKEIEANS